MPVTDLQLMIIAMLLWMSIMTGSLLSQHLRRTEGRTLKRIFIDYVHRELAEWRQQKQKYRT